LMRLLVGGAAAAADPPVAARPIVFEANLEYGTGAGDKLTLNLARPQGGESPFPVVVFIHGGAWQGGNKELHDPQIKELAQRGYAAASVGYRLAPKHPFPAQIEDCKCAVRWLRAHAAEYQLDPQRIGAVGLSAGAHLAMMLGATDGESGLEGAGGSSDQSSQVQCVVSFAGPTDLTAEFPDVSVEILDKFVGRAERDAERAKRLERASPVHYVDQGDAPMLLFQGTKDPLIPTAQAFAMGEALSSANVPGRIELLVGAQHGWGEPDLTRTMNAMYAFLDQHLRTAR
ncbi:MAG: alpha/beta hydrolase, partial [Planctomycetaceae bacterium]|nr:alpha/beta hydrolase [Planctomycetaceae bacterium]